MKLCWHKWSNWSDPVMTRGLYKQQWRCCKKCNKADFTTLRLDDSALHHVLSSLASIRQPLTDDEIDQGCQEANSGWMPASFKAGVRFAEKHHGIGERDE